MPCARGWAVERTNWSRHEYGMGCLSAWPERNGAWYEKMATKALLSTEYVLSAIWLSGWTENEVSVCKHRNSVRQLLPEYGSFGSRSKTYTRSLFSDWDMQDFLWTGNWPVNEPFPFFSANKCRDWYKGKKWNGHAGMYEIEQASFQRSAWLRARSHTPSTEGAANL